MGVPETLPLWPLQVPDSSTALSGTLGVLETDVSGQEFHSNWAVKLGIQGLIDHAHTAAAQLFQHAVVRNCLANLWIGAPPTVAILAPARRQVNAKGN